MSDYISRDVAIENAISQMRVSKSELCMRERLMNLPAADVRPVVRGKWEAHEAYKGAAWGFLECSVCGNKSWTIKHNYCPNCGSDMREES